MLGQIKSQLYIFLIEPDSVGPSLSAWRLRANGAGEPSPMWLSISLQAGRQAGGLPQKESNTATSSGDDRCHSASCDFHVHNLIQKKKKIHETFSFLFINRLRLALGWSSQWTQLTQAVRHNHELG